MAKPKIATTTVMMGNDGDDDEEDEVIPNANFSVYTAKSTR